MAINLSSIVRKPTIKPPRMLIYGVEGIGKSTLGANAPNPVFILTEDGLGGIDVPHFPLATSSDDVIAAISSLATEPNEFETVVIDSIDWLEAIIRREVEQKYSEAQRAYGKGTLLEQEKFREILAGLNYLRDEKGMIVILIGHSAIKRIEPPDTEAYDRYCVKLQEKTSALIREWCDLVGFANYKINIRKTEGNFGKSQTRAVGNGERLLHVTELPAWQAKNRYGINDALPMDWASLQSVITNQSI
jgi:hypothetical protein